MIVWFHWGTELHAEPDSRQQQFAEAALAAGARVVLGAHPHVFGAVERPQPRDLVAWTLGNFVFPFGLSRDDEDRDPARASREQRRQRLSRGSGEQRCSAGACGLDAVDRFRASPSTPLR